MEKLQDVGLAIKEYMLMVLWGNITQVKIKLFKTKLLINACLL